MIGLLLKREAERICPWRTTWCCEYSILVAIFLYELVRAREERGLCRTQANIFLIGMFD